MTEKELQKIEDASVPKVSEEYTAEAIQVLKGLEGVRQRPAMYIGDVGVQGLHHMIWEVLDNAIDEAVAGHAKNITVIIHEDESITVRDDGRGIPVDIHPEEGKSALEVVMTTLHAGGKFDKKAYKISGGLHGVGVSCVNALSEHMIVKVYRDGKIYRQEYRQGVPQTGVEVIGETTERGTEVWFKPDPTIFKVTRFNRETVAARLRELAFLNPGLKLTLIDERERDEEGNPWKQVFYSEKGLIDFVKFLDETRESIMSEPFYASGKKDDIIVEVAFEYNTSTIESMHSFVNNINTREGGPHESGFRRALTRAVKGYAEKQGWLGKAKVNITGDDFKEGLTAVISVKLPNPQFGGQTKTKLANPEAGTAVEAIVFTKLSEFLEEHPSDARAIFEKALTNAQAREAARKARTLVQRKSALTRSTLPGKLADCSSRKPEESELFLVEGDSAGGTAKQARDRRFQAILPLRGKILNVEKAPEHKIFDNEEIRNIFTALGVPPMKDFEEADLSKLRYHKIIIMTDADVDGAHISTLLLTLFYRYLRPLIDKGYVYIAMPPLYLVKRGKEKIYCWTDEERDKAIEKLSQDGKRDAVVVQRYKGLGEMNAEQLWETTMNPETRFLKKVTIHSAAEADRIFTILMGDDVPPRREFIETHAQYANLDV